jgi:tripartite ATP-independent transporter DctM subunit
VRGGLALGTMGLMIIISMVNGLSVAGMAIGATVALPELLRRGYDKTMITGVIQGGSSLGIMGPPSVVLILYAMIARQPVLQLWLAGIGPFILMAVVFTLYIYIRCRIQPELAPILPAEERANITTHEKLVLLREGLLPFGLFAAIMGLFFSGTTSLVETSMVGALLSLLAAWFSGKLTKDVLEVTTRNTLAVSAMFLWIILGALCFSAVYDGLGAIKAIEGLLLNTFDLSPWGVLSMMLFSFIILGMFLDDTAMLVIVAPLYIPLVKLLGFDLIWFGILYTITCQIAYIVPPFGYNLFLMRAMAPPEITIVDIYKSIVPFFFLMVFCMIVIMVFPDIAMYLPDLYSGKR